MDRAYRNFSYTEVFLLTRLHGQALAPGYRCDDSRYRKLQKAGARWRLKTEFSSLRFYKIVLRLDRVKFFATLRGR
jgi:hypothetical protein